jgi:hypothetical protein
LLLFAPVLLLAILLWVASTPWFMTHNAYPAMRNMGYELTLQHENCEIVLAGDSSALVAYDPEVVERLTGMKTCNVSEGSPVLSVVGSYPLDTYLSRNQRPKFLVMMFTPQIYHPSPYWLSGSDPEGYTYLLQYVRGKRLYFALRKPHKLLEYAAWVGNRLLTDALQRLQGEDPDAVAKDGGIYRREHHGQYQLPFPPETQCMRSIFHERAEDVHGDPEGVAAARRKYGMDGTRVFINLSPVPSCSAMRDTYERVLAGEHDNAFEQLPITWYNSEDVHVNETGAIHISTEVAQQILGSMHNSMGSQAAESPTRVLPSAATSAIASLSK